MLLPGYDMGMSRKGRITVTLDPAVIDAANAAVSGGRAVSVSAWINAALGEHVGKERRLAAMRKALAMYEAEYGVITPEEMAAQERADRRNAIVVRGSGRRPSRRRTKAG